MIDLKEIIRQYAINSTKSICLVLGPFSAFLDKDNGLFLPRRNDYQFVSYVDKFSIDNFVTSKKDFDWTNVYFGADWFEVIIAMIISSDKIIFHLDDLHFTHNPKQNINRPNVDEVSSFAELGYIIKCGYLDKCIFVCSGKIVKLTTAQIDFVESLY